MFGLSGLVDGCCGFVRMIGTLLWVCLGDLVVCFVVDLYVLDWCYGWGLVALWACRLVICLTICF